MSNDAANTAVVCAPQRRHSYLAVACDEKINEREMGERKRSHEFTRYRNSSRDEETKPHDFFCERWMEQIINFGTECQKEDAKFGMKSIYKREIFFTLRRLIGRKAMPRNYGVFLPR